MWDLLPNLRDRMSPLCLLMQWDFFKCFAKGQNLGVPSQLYCHNLL